MAAPMAWAVILLLAIEFLLSDDNVYTPLDINTLTLCMLITYRRKKYKSIEFFETVVPRYRHDQFRRFFRMSRESFEHLSQCLGQCRELRTRVYQGGREEICLDKKILMTLRYLASQETVYEISDRFGVTEMAFLKHKQAIISAINKYLFKRFITWPRNDEMDNIAGEFNDMGAYFFPNIIGAIDGTHIQIEPNVANPQAYFNRKKFYSVILQAVCKEDMYFTSVNVGWPGRVHDAKVLRNSQLWEAGFTRCQDGHYHILGDGAYPLRNWLLTPYRDTGNLTREQSHYNRNLSSKRQIIERAFGLLKGRFRRLRYVNIKSMETVCKTIIASCIMHNMCLMCEDDVEEFMLADEDCHDVNLPQVFPERNEEGVQKRLQITNQLAQ